MDSYILAIDQGTSSSRVVLFDNTGKSLSQYQQEFDCALPQPGWCEQDGIVDIMDTVYKCINEMAAEQKDKISKIKGIGITNQRETTIVWDKTTGKPLYNAIVWLDTRTHVICSELVKKYGSKDHFRSSCGLPITTYFSGMKLKWLLENVPEVEKASKEGRALFGTIDSWLIWNLTGGVNGGLHITDVTNASRTMLMDLKTLQWSQENCDALGIPMSLLPTIKSSAEVYGKVAEGPLKGIPICGCLGDQQAALVGQSCFNKGDVKNTYGTGCFMLFNTGEQAIQSTHGLLTTVGYKFGADKAAVYALEGSIAIAGVAVKWLRDNMGIISSASEIEPLAKSVNDTAGVYFVPAFSGLFAPYWRDDARGLVIGLTQFTTKAHLARATLEATCFQAKEIIDSMEKDSGVSLKVLKVDGGMTVNNLLLQLQADILGITVSKPENTETTALGAAFAAGIATGLWSESNFPALKASEFNPLTNKEQRQSRLREWQNAVQRSMNWVE